ncbi:MAG: LamG domain-containing protein [Planctomycetes bacterium]|nr:LamG domain-containing protein [Planctomycetota bacterium]
MRSSLLSFLALAAALPAQNAALSFSNAVDGYVEVPYSPAVVPQSGITVEAWVTYDESTLGSGWRYPTVVRQNRNAGQESFFLRINADNINRTVVRWLVHANSTLTVDWTFTPGQLLNWTHLAGTWDGQTARLFVNGTEMASRVGSGALADLGDVLRIGKGSDVATPIEVWNGEIDEVRLWPYARTAAEIQATMNQELLSVPGGVSTWNFNGHLLDTSAGRNATMSGAVQFTGVSPTLTSHVFPGIAAGASTPGCFGAIQAAPTALPQVGNAGFAVVAHRGAVGAPTICAISAGPSVAPLPIAGIAIWLDIGSLVGGYSVPVDALGTARMGLSVPAAMPVGLPVATQFVSADPCGPLGLTASNVVAFQLVM